MTAIFAITVSLRPRNSQFAWGIIKVSPVFFTVLEIVHGTECNETAKFPIERRPVEEPTEEVYKVYSTVSLGMGEN